VAVHPSRLAELVIGPRFAQTRWLAPQDDGKKVLPKLICPGESESAMAQLSDDCFAFGGPMLSVDDAVAMITSRVRAVEEIDTVTLTEADGRTLAADIVAPLPLPPFTNSAVDGYALASRELPVTQAEAFPVAARVRAGSAAPEQVAPRHAVRIFTGAPMPKGLDTVFMQEDVQLDAGQNAGQDTGQDTNHVVLPPGLKAGANVRPAGEDIAAGELALRAGTRLRPQDVALVAAFGLTTVAVRRRIRVAVFSTGEVNIMTTDGFIMREDGFITTGFHNIMAAFHHITRECGHIKVAFRHITSAFLDNTQDFRFNMPEFGNIIRNDCHLTPEMAVL